MPDELRAGRGYYAVGGCGGNIAWHTENDTIEIADKDILLRDMKVYLAPRAGVANAVIFPFDSAAGRRSSADARPVRPGGRRSLRPFASAAGGGCAEAALEAFYAGAAAAMRGGDPDACRRYNEAILRLARILVPINFTGLAASGTTRRCPFRRCPTWRRR